MEMKHKMILIYTDKYLCSIRNSGTRQGVGFFVIFQT